MTAAIHYTTPNKISDKIHTMLSKMSQSPFYIKSERNLLLTHNTLASAIKRTKRLLMKRGKMMKTFDYINRLHEKNDNAAIERVVDILYSEIKPDHIHQSNRYKYYELISYCYFLQEYKFVNDATTLADLATDLIKILNMGHELGRSIERQVKMIVTT